MYTKGQETPNLFTFWESTFCSAAEKKLNAPAQQQNFFYPFHQNHF